MAHLGLARALNRLSAEGTYVRASAQHVPVPMRASLAPVRPPREFAFQNLALLDSLKAWVRERRVAFEQAPLREQVDGDRIQVGVEFRLFAQLPESAKMDPGSPQSRRLYAKLKAIARSVLPKERPDTRCQIEPSDAALRLRPETHWKPEVQLTVRVEHRTGHLRPIGRGERDCAEELRRRLVALGAGSR